ncbi:unnamed protein product [Phytophthora fragariaefolia]|uniref:Unnamed protein product n=1 Tax=Phytophthora fragariaefolia TaxID=1490495 RepID=A0A9W6YPX7_9STRA|nr:unnamed protein product [Phytophthora fragariaefolia]
MNQSDSIVVTADTEYDSDGSLVGCYFNAYNTLVNIESGTDQIISSRKQSQVSRAVSSLTTVANDSMSDLV